MLPAAVLMQKHKNSHAYNHVWSEENFAFDGIRRGKTESKFFGICFHPLMNCEHKSDWSPSFLLAPLKIPTRDESKLSGKIAFWKLLINSSRMQTGKPCNVKYFLLRWAEFWKDKMLKKDGGKMIPLPLAHRTTTISIFSSRWTVSRALTVWIDGK